MDAIPEDDPRHRMLYGADDDAHLTEAGIPSFVCGPIAVREVNGQQYVDIDSMLRISQNLALTAYDICTKSKEQPTQAKNCQHASHSLFKFW